MKSSMRFFAGAGWALALVMLLAACDAKSGGTQSGSASSGGNATAPNGMAVGAATIVPGTAAPDDFKVRFELSNGAVVAEFHKAWAPIGVQQMYDLVNAGYYNGARFFRVVPGFVVQFGLAADPAVTAKWDKNIVDDPVKGSNARGIITFATGGPNTRTTQLFINLGNNARLDGQGFAPIGEVTEGMDVVDKINSEYRQQPDQGAITSQGNAYLNSQFPRLDYIKSATLLK